MFPVIKPIALNGSKLGFAETSPVSGFTLEFSKLTLPNVCCRSSNATLCLNSFCNCLAPKAANCESCERLPSEPLGLSLNKIFTGV